MRKDGAPARFFVALMVLGLALAACQAQSGGGIQPTNLLDQAAAEATSIVQQAEATAMVLQARARATAVMAQVQTFNVTPTPAPTRVVQLSPQDRATATPTPSPQQEDDLQPASSEQTIEVLRVSFAGEGAMIHVQFLAPPEAAAKWWPGSVSVIHEATEMIYNEIPVMPKIGPLIGRPKQAGQLGYVMLTHYPRELQPGSQVTVVLGNYEFKHIPVQ